MGTIAASFDDLSGNTAADAIIGNIPEYDGVGLYSYIVAYFTFSGYLDTGT